MMIDFWLSKNIADALYGLIVLAMFFIIMFIASAIKSAFNRHNKNKFYKQFKESKRKDDKNNG
ncbi:hypothetical protein [Lachnospira eligens]|jgi:hypothetical protein|nr:hypothetical protein [Lachnospira eligens]